MSLTDEEMERLTQDAKGMTDFGLKSRLKGVRDEFDEDEEALLASLAKPEDQTFEGLMVLTTKRLVWIKRRPIISNLKTSIPLSNITGVECSEGDSDWKDRMNLSIRTDDANHAFYTIATSYHLERIAERLWSIMETGVDVPEAGIEAIEGTESTGEPQPDRHRLPASWSTDAEAAHPPNWFRNRVENALTAYARIDDLQRDAARVAEVLSGLGDLSLAKAKEYGRKLAEAGASTQAQLFGKRLQKHADASESKGASALVTPLLPGVGIASYLSNRGKEKDERRSLETLGHQVIEKRDTTVPDLEQNTQFRLPGNGSTVTYEGSEWLLEGPQGAMHAFGDAETLWAYLDSELDLPDTIPDSPDSRPGEAGAEEEASGASEAALAEDLERLTRLHEEGALSDAEFQAAKDKLLD